MRPTLRTPKDNSHYIDEKKMGVGRENDGKGDAKT
jgi:hypothetical protein